jgi:hypothetical protein
MAMAIGLVALPAGVHAVVRTDTTTTLTSTLNPSLVGQEVTFTATVATQ